jgi:twitching motility protein PilU
MQTFDMALFDLYEAGQISYEDAIRGADSMNELRLAIKLEGHEAKARDPFAETEGLRILGEEDEGATPAASLFGVSSPPEGVRSTTVPPKG